MAYIGKLPTVGNFQVCDAISVVNGQAAYTMQVGSVNVVPENANNMIVSLNGVIQAPISSYTVSGSTITFASALVTGDSIDFIQILGDVLDLGVPSDGTVTSAKITYPLTTFSSTGIDDNATSTAVTIDSSENVGIGISPTPPTAYGGLHIHSTYPVMKLSSTATGSGTGDGFVTRIDSTPRVELWNFENSDMVFATNNTERMRIRAGGGLAIGGTGDANTLSDYEEGTWTPNIIYGGTITVGTKNSSYLKIGNLVYISVHVTITSVSSPSGDLRIGSLPFTPDSSSSAGPAFSMSYYDWNSGTYFLNGELNYGNNSIYIYNNNNGVRNSSADKIQGGSQFHLAGSYIST